MRPIWRIALHSFTIGVIFAAFTSSCARVHADSSSLPKKVIAMEGVTEYQLDNGGRLVLFPDPQATRLTVNMVVFVGSRHEGYGEAGMAHLLEHLVCKGTPTHQNIPKLLTQHGAMMAASANATTSYDRTNYYETMPAGDENLEFGIKLEADRLVNSFIKREDLVSEMTLVRNEFEIGENSPKSILEQRMRAAAYAWHNYGKSIIGNRSDIERVPIDRLQAFYRKHYQPDNAMLFISGKFNERKALEYAGKYFGALKRPARQLDATYTEEPPQDGERTVTLRRVGSAAAVGALYHIPAARHEDGLAIDVLVDVLTAEPSGRLYQALVESKKAINVSGNATNSLEPGVVTFSAIVDPSQPVEEIRDILLQVVEGLSSAPVTAEEVQRAKRKLVNQFEEYPRRGEQMALVLGECAALGDWRLFYWAREQFPKVTPADVMRVAGRYLQRNNRTVGLFLPTKRAERVAIPQAPAASEMLKEFQPAVQMPAPTTAEQPQQASKVQTETTASNKTSDPTADDIEKRVQRSQLPGGVKVALLRKTTVDGKVGAQLVLRFGNEQSLKGYPFCPALLAKLIENGGTKHHSFQQLRDELAKLNADLSVIGEDGVLSCNVVSKKENFEQALRILCEVLREPLLGEKESNLLKQQFKHDLEAARTDPTSRAVLEIGRKLHPLDKDHVRYRASLDESIAQLDAVTLDQVRKLYAEQLGGQVGEFAVVGEFDPQRTQEIIQKALGDWKASVIYQRIPYSARIDIAAERLDLLTPDKANAFYICGHMLQMNDRDPDYYALRVANHVFGGDPLNSRLGNRIRHKDGLSYSFQSNFIASELDAYAQFIIVANANPQNIDRLDKAIVEELTKFVAKGITESELADTKKFFLQQRTQLLSDDGWILSRLVNDLHLGVTLEDFANRTKQIASLTVADVNAAIRKHLAMDRLIIVRAGDFKKDKSRTVETASPSAPAKSAATDAGTSSSTAPATKSPASSAAPETTSPSKPPAPVDLTAASSNMSPSGTRVAVPQSVPSTKPSSATQPMVQAKSSSLPGFGGLIHGDRRRAKNIGGQRFDRNRARGHLLVELVASPAQAHRTITVVNVVRTPGLPGPGIFRSDAALYSALDSNQRTYKKPDDIGKVQPFSQCTITHEIGHALGLPHIGVTWGDPACKIAAVLDEHLPTDFKNHSPAFLRGGTASDVCYGTYAPPKRGANVMGFGSSFDETNAQPWRDRIALHTGTKPEAWKVFLKRVPPNFV